MHSKGHFLEQEDQLSGNGGENGLVLLKEILTFLMARLSWSPLGLPEQGIEMCSAKG